MNYRKCFKCRGLNGQPKNIYPTKTDAMVVAIAYLESSRPVKLKYYKCPASNGYHLTEKM